MSDVVLRMAGITKRFGSLVANEAIELELRRGEVMALLGENGAGKTTLMNILFGHYVADAGQVLVASGQGGLVPLPPGSPGAALAAGIGMVHQHFTLAANLTVLDNVVLGTEPLWRLRQDRSGAGTRLAALMRDCGLEVPLGRRVGELSVGEAQRVEILKALYRNARVLILDEPTAVLTPQEAEALFATLRRLAGQGLAVVFISHKLGEVLALSDRVAVLRGGRKVAETATRDADRAHLAELMVGRIVPEPRRLPLVPGEPVLELQGVGSAGLEAVDLTLHAREVVGIAGVSGNGQAALADLLAGLRQPTSGTMRLVGSGFPEGGPAAVVAAGVGRIPEDRNRQGVIGDLAVADNLILEQRRSAGWQRWGVLRREAVARHARELIARFDVRCEGPAQRIRLLSGGNVQKLVLGRALEREPRLILANQPTRGLDVGAVAYVHDRLLEARGRGAAILLISEDLDELLALSDRVAVIYRGRLGPALPTESLTLRELGLMMAGHLDHAA
jgi:simple sugar transport system ATP-binding protein